MEDLTALGDVSHSTAHDLVGLAASDGPSFLAFADPFTLDADLLLTRIRGAFPDARVAGGLSSGGAEPGGGKSSSGGKPS